MFWRKKKKTKSPTPKTKEQSPESKPLPSLPDELIVSILARVSRSYYPNLSLVSKSFRSILTSPELYKVRTLLSRNETFLYVCLRFPDEANPHWFTLYRKPNQTLANKEKREDSSVHLLAPTPILNSPNVDWSSIIVVGSNLYAISSEIHESPCSNVWYIDCQTHTWLEAPRMRIAHTNTLYDGNVYLPGSSESPDSFNCVEVYNTETQAWNLVPCNKRIRKFENMDGIIIYMNLIAESPWVGMALNPNVLTSGLVGLHTRLKRVSYCTIDNVYYQYAPSSYLTWRGINTHEGGVSRRLKGLEGLPEFSDSTTVKLADYGGKLVVFWDKYVPAIVFKKKKKMMWCAEISLEKRNSEEIWGKVEWCDAVLTVPKSYKFVCAKSVTV